MRYHWIFDIDNTVVDHAHREHFIKCENPDWVSFHEYDQIMRDHAREWTKGLWHRGTFKYGNHSFLTARDERCRIATMDQLSKFGFISPSTEVIMKPAYWKEESKYYKARHLLTFLMDVDVEVVFVEDLPHIIEVLNVLKHPRLNVLDAQSPNIRAMVDEFGAHT